LHFLLPSLYLTDTKVPHQTPVSSGMRYIILETHWMIPRDISKHASVEHAAALYGCPSRTRCTYTAYSIYVIKYETKMNIDVKSVI
jgi:hypothetical protein